MKIIAIGDVHGRDYWKYVSEVYSFDKLEVGTDRLLFIRWELQGRI